MIELPAQDLAPTPSPLWWRLRAEWIYTAITSGELPDHTATKEVRYVVQLEVVGHLNLPGGQLVAADPYVMDAEPEPFTQALPTEAAEVVVARVTVGAHHERVAALVLHTGPGPISEWHMATTPNQDTSTLEPETFFGYGVDAGTGSFGSPEAMKVAHRVLSADAGMLDDPVSKALFSDGIGTRSAVVVAPESGTTPIAACSSGWGDGFYPTWLGVDISGNVVVAVTDFLLTSDPHATPAPPDDTSQAPPETPTKSLLRRLFRR